MTNPISSIALSAFVIGATLAGPASALVLQASYTGTVEAGSDKTGLFGSGNVLDGLAYSLVFTYDPATPGGNRTRYSGDYRAADDESGGSLWGVPSPIRSAAITIKNHTRSFVTGFDDALSADRAGAYSMISQSASYSGIDSKGEWSNSLYATATANKRPGGAPRLEQTVPLTALAASPDAWPNGGGSCRSSPARSAATAASPRRTPSPR